MIAVDIVAFPYQSGARVDCHSERLVCAGRDEILPRGPDVLACHFGVRPYSTSKRLHRHPPAHPSVGGVARVHLLVLASNGRSIRPLIGDDAPVHRCGHVADYTRASRPSDHSYGLSFAACSVTSSRALRGSKPATGEPSD